MTENNKWYVSKGAEGDVAVSTRIRLARNLSGYPFPCRWTPEQASEGIRIVKEAVTDPDAGATDTFEYVDMAALPAVSAMGLAERHLISPEFAASATPRALLLTKDEAVSVMLGEEDHIRLQVMRPGLALEEAFDRANGLDDFLDGRLPYAFDERLGYLTQCPTNLGTGMRASVMLHLPALTLKKQISQLAGTVGKLGLTIRGSFGEGTEAKGDLYQLSNQITLGISEAAALHNLSSITMQVIDRERAARRELMASPELPDRIFRSYGVLKYAKSMSADEFMGLISYVRLGSALEALDVDGETVSALIAEVQPAALMAGAGRDMTAQERDAARAEIVNKRL